MALFHLEGAHAAYNGKRVLHDINLVIEAGEKVSLIGSSGAGKSTLLTLLHGQQPGTSSWVPQDPSLVSTLSVFHNTFMGRLDRNPTWYNLVNLVRPLSRETEAVGELLESLGLGEKRFSPAGELSGGEQQRTGVARALYRGNDVVLADEPVSAVDPAQARTVLERLVTAHGTAVLAMHDVTLALEFTQRVIGLRDGRIVLDRSSAGLEPSELIPVFQI